MILNPFTELFTFDVSAVNALLLGSLSSGTSYALCMFIGDGGFQHEYRIRGNVDTEVDAKARRKITATIFSQKTSVKVIVPVPILSLLAKSKPPAKRTAMDAFTPSLFLSGK
jgi:hypothetical protein